MINVQPLPMFRHKWPILFRVHLTDLRRPHCLEVEDHNINRVDIDVEVIE